MSGGFDVVVLGLGAMGSAAAYHLARRGRRVLGLEQFGPAHALGSSHGHSRIYRQAYLEGEHYVPLCIRAGELWRELEGASGRELLRQTGGLMIGAEDSAVVRGTLASAHAHGLPYQLLTNAVLHRRYPQFAADRGEVAVFEETAGALFPEDAIIAHLHQAVALSAELRFGVRCAGWSADANGVEVEAGGEKIRADHLVIAAGAWAARALASLNLPLVPERNVQHWFRPAARAPFTAERLPVFIWEQPERALYGLPDLRGEGVKVAFHHSDEAVDPDSLDRTPRQDEIAAIRSRVAQRLPALAGAPCASEVCLYTNTPDEQFVIGLHPEQPRIVLAAGFSGHGFKFASVVGEILADLALAGTTGHPIARFSPGRFHPSQAAQPG